MPGWNEPSAAYYRKLEQEQRALAADASCSATGDIHLEFAEKYRLLAEEVEAQGTAGESDRAASDL